MSQFSLCSVPESQSSCDSSVSQSQNSEKTKGLTDISSLHPDACSEWKIKAKVVSKSDVKPFVDNIYVKKLFVVNLSDNSGVIRATMFDKAGAQFYNLLQLNKMYYISNGSIRPASKEHSTIEHDFELNLGLQTIVEPCPENDNGDAIPNITFNFTPIEDIEEMEIDRFIDVIGIISSVGEVDYPGDKILQKIELLGLNHKIITVCFWGRNAGKLNNDSKYSVLALKAVKVAQFKNNKNIHISEMQSIIVIDPDIPETKQLKNWFELNKHQSYNEFDTNSDKVTGDEGRPTSLDLTNMQMQKISLEDKSVSGPQS